MTPAARIEAVIELLTEIMATPRPADTIASLYFRSRRFIGSKDRNAITTRLYRIIREYHRLGWWVIRGKDSVSARNLVIASILFDKDRGSETLGSLFTGDRFAPYPLSKEEKKLAGSMEEQEFQPPAMPLKERTECPDWAFESLQKALGDRFETEMEAMLQPAPLDIRVNTIKTTRDELLLKLKREGYDAHAGKISPVAIRLLGRPQILQNPLFKDGFFEIQDEGSQMVALVADAKPGEQVVDFCAGAGGKTLALGAAMQNKGRLIAMDVLGGRLAKAKLRFRRAGLHNIETRELTSERDKFVKRHPGSFDLVLIDAPCTGTGTWRRDPGQRWRQLGPSLAELLELQVNILDSAHRMVKPGGRLVYATCSLLQEENEHQMEAFLAKNPEFSIKPIKDIIDMPAAERFLRLTPAQNDTDGFFAAVLTRKQAAEK